MTTNKTENLLTAIWARHAGQTAFWRALCLIQLALTGLAQLLCARLHNRPREVVQIGCDGIPQLVRLEVEQYTEPNEREMQAFARLDSFSAVNDAVFAARYMIPELREAYRRRMRGNDGEPGRLAEIDAPWRRTEIDPNGLEVKIDTGVYPWSVTVRGVRKIVGTAEAQRFGLDVQLVRAARAGARGGCWCRAFGTSRAWTETHRRVARDERRGGGADDVRARAHPSRAGGHR